MVEVVESAADFSDLLFPFSHSLSSPPLFLSPPFSLSPPFLPPRPFDTFVSSPPVFCSRFFRFFHQSTSPPPPSSFLFPCLLSLPLLLESPLRNQSSFSLLRKFHVADRFNARYGRDIGRSFFLSFLDRCVPETSDPPCRGDEERVKSTLFFARSRASAQAPHRFFLRTRTEPKFERPLSNFSTVEGGGGGSIPLDPNNNRSWNGLHLDSPAANNRKNGGIFNYRAKYLFRIVIPFLLEIYFLGWINYSIRIRSYIRFLRDRSQLEICRISRRRDKVVVFLFLEETILKIDRGLSPPFPSEASRDCWPR